MEQFVVTLKPESPKGEDGHRVFSIRVTDETYKKLDLLSGSSRFSRNSLINAMINHCLNHGVFQDGKEQFNIIDL